jgi:hypothetical protein
MANPDCSRPARRTRQVGGIACMIASSTPTGARNSFAQPRDWGAKNQAMTPLSATETDVTAFEPAEMPANGGLFVETRKRRFASDCVVGLGGLEHEASSLWIEY